MKLLHSLRVTPIDNEIQIFSDSEICDLVNERDLLGK